MRKGKPNREAPEVPEDGVNLNEVPRRRRETFISAYSNQAQVQSAPFDFRLLFGEVVTDQAGKLSIEEIAAISLSPQHAKTLLYLLARNIKLWEQRWGEIQINEILRQISQGGLTDKVDG